MGGFFTNRIPEVTTSFLLNMFFAAICALILGHVYQRFGKTINNRESLSRNFLMLSLCTMLIISVVKSSIALSLGLVGALSIVRFRAAIKEPEELTYLFWAIAIGLGFGANQGMLTSVALAVIVLLIAIRHLFSKPYTAENIHLTIGGPNTIDINQITNILKKDCKSLKLIRLDDTSENIEVSFLAEYQNLDSLLTSKAKLKEMDENIRLIFLEQSGLQ